MSERPQPEPPWFAVHTQPGRESVAEASLVQLGVEVFAPRYRKRVLLHGYRREVARPLFPAYVFAAFDLRESFRSVHYARGVRGVVRFGDEPAAVPAALIEQIRSRMHDGWVTLDPPRFQPGQRVEIVGGLFQGYRGIFAEHLRDHERVAILLDGLNYQARAELDIGYVQAMGE